uniref:Reverse transcriptase domain-containing protein n=1 Tax=Tanacetum cinerariifolium TaxID=118510 RepID=A0A6L2JKM0_TANCI|nr:reverse transcriptase domain-containing protein [Tanacetum cinerariifolium]
MATEENGDPPVPDLWTIEELCQPTLNGRGGPIAQIAIQATIFGLKNDIIQQVKNSCQFHGLPGVDANKHHDKFLHVTQSIKVNRVTDDALPLSLFPHSLTHHATAWFDRLPRNSINTFEQMAKMFLGKYFPPSMVTKLRNEITNFRQRPDESLFEAWEQINKNLMKVLQINQQVKAVAHNCETCGGPHSYNDCPATMNTASFSGSRTLPSNTVTNSKEDLKGITTRSGNAYQGPTIPTTSSSLPNVVERKTEIETPIPNSEPVVAPAIDLVVSPVSAPKPNQKPLIPYPSRLHDQKLRDKANDQKEKIFQIFQDLNFNISFADALILMPKFGPTIKSLLTNKDKLFELAKTPLNEHCSAFLLKKLSEKLRDPDKFLIPCDFLRMDECLALADLGASINLMPLSVWNKLSLPELTPTLMTLELADRSISRPIGVAEDIFIKGGKRSFLKTGRSLIDVYAGELTLRVNNEAVTFNLDQTSRYSANYNDMTANQIDVIDMACEEYSQEVLGFSDVIEVDAFLALKEDPTSPEVDHSYYDMEGDILLLEAFLTKNDKSSIDEPPEVELKDLPLYIEYTFLEGNDKFPVIIAKDLSVEEKAALIKVLKSPKQAIAWKLSESLWTISWSLGIHSELVSPIGNKMHKAFLLPGYTAVPPPPAQLYLSPKKDLSWTGLPECADDIVTDYSRLSPTVESTSEDDQNKNPSVSENVPSPITPKPFIKFVKPKDSQPKSKTDKKEIPKKPQVKYAEQYKKPNKKPNVKGNQRNWNNLKSHQLGPDFVIKKKSCFNYGDFNHLAYDCRKRVKKNFTPRPVAHKPYRPSQRPVRTNMNDARPNRTFFNKQAHSYANRPIHRTSAVRSPYRALWVPTVNRNYPLVNRKFSTGSRNFPTANRKLPIASRKFSTSSTKSPTADIGRKGKAIKPSACWFWRPSQNLSNKGPKNNSVSGSFQNKIDDKGYWDNGCSRYMTCNISYLSDYEPFDGGYVSFGQGGCKITEKGTIKTGKLEFENVYFMKDLKDFKLLDDANILLRTPRHHNMYSIDLNNIVLHRDLTCLVAKASANECML